MESYKKIFLISLVSLISYVLSQKCTEYKCSDLPGSLCLRKIINETSRIEAKSSEDKNKTCPFYRLSSKDEVYFEDKIQLPTRQYPGGPCMMKDDCMNNAECKNNICQGIEAGQNCERHDQCYFGYACYKNSTESNFTTCNKLQGLDANCTSEYECQMTQGCFKGKCTDYYSLKDGENVESNKYESSHSFCASGHDRYGLCESMRNINAEQVVSDELVKCDESNPCRYTSINGTIIKSDVCKCGKSSDSSRYCPIYGGNKNYKNGIKIIKKLISEKRENCNTVERDTVCIFYEADILRNGDIQTYKTIKTKLNSYHEFAHAEDCIKNIFYPFYSKEFDIDPVDPVDNNKKCPLFKCNSQNNAQNQTCALSYADINTNNTVVDLFSKSCQWDKQTCNYVKDNFSKEDNISICKEKNNFPKSTRYPGESCIEDKDCFILNGIPVEGVGKCINNKCTGFSIGQNCFHTTQCLSGHYCKIDSNNNSTCQLQEKEKSDCNSFYDCANNLLCYNKKCSNLYFSMQPGEKIEYKNLNNSDLEYAKKICRFELEKKINDEYGLCVMKVNSDKVNTEQGSLVPCVPDQKCNYTLTDNKDIKDESTGDCECGFNPTGQGYCKTGHNISKF